MNDDEEMKINLILLGVWTILAGLCMADADVLGFQDNLVDLLTGLPKAAPGKHQLDTMNAMIAGPVPGDNPVETCDDPSTFILNITELQVSPNPPKEGKTLSVEAFGTLSEDVIKGSYVVVTVNYGYIKLLNARYDLCDLVKDADLTCPLQKKIHLAKSADLPAAIPPVSYHVN